jgi:hypothetical protein
MQAWPGNSSSRPEISRIARNIPYSKTNGGLRFQPTENKIHTNKYGGKGSMERKRMRINEED